MRGGGIGGGMNVKVIGSEDDIGGRVVGELGIGDKELLLRKNMLSDGSGKFGLFDVGDGLGMVSEEKCMM